MFSLSPFEVFGCWGQHLNPLLLLILHHEWLLFTVQTLRGLAHHHALRGSSSSDQLDRPWCTMLSTLSTCQVVAVILMLITHYTRVVFLLGWPTIAQTYVLSSFKELLLVSMLAWVLLRNIHLTVPLTYPNHLEGITCCDTWWVGCLICQSYVGRRVKDSFFTWKPICSCVLALHNNGPMMQRQRGLWSFLALSANRLYLNDLFHRLNSCLSVLLNLLTQHPSWVPLGIVGCLCLWVIHIVHILYHDIASSAYVNGWVVKGCIGWH